MNTDPLVLQRTYNAPVEQIWNALTNVDAMRRWYFPVSDFKAEVGFEFSFPGEGPEGRRYLHRCRVTRVIPNRLIAYTWSYEGYEGESELSFELHAEGEGTRLVLTHSGLHSFPRSNPDLAAGNFVQGWTWFLDTGLPDFLQGKGREME